MKIIRTIVLAFLLFIGCVIVNGQNPIPNEFAGLCGFCDSLLPMETIENSCAHQSLLYSDNSLWFPNSNDELKYVKVNFIFLHKQEDGLGNFSNESLEHQDVIYDLVLQINNVFSNLYNPTDSPCYVNEGFISNSRIQIVSNIIHYVDAYYWNNENEGQGEWLSELNSQIANDSSYEKGINIYFTENQTEFNNLVVYHTTQEQPQPIVGWANPPMISDIDASSIIHMPGVFSKYYWMKNFAPSIYNKPWDPTVRNWFIHSVGNQIAHELGHSLSLEHIDPCQYNLMSINPIHGYFEESLMPDQIGQIHRYLSISSVRKYTTDNSYLSTPYSITADDVWDLNFTSYRDVVIESGATLTITCKLVMKSNARIIIKPGGKLIVDGGIITTEDSILWPGIEVWGNRYAHQFEINGSYEQGYLELKNGAVIENARCAVELWRPEYWGTTGGIVRATDATFRNNATSVHAISYSNFYPNTYQEASNHCRFENCEFVVDDNYLGTETFTRHVTLSDVKGIGFFGCDFSAKRGVTGVYQWCIGINAYDAGFSVRSLCASSLVEPCPEEDIDRSTFTGLCAGIRSSSNGSHPRSFSVKDAVFTNNDIGIHAINSGFPTILMNEFAISQEDYCDYNYGVFLDHVTDFCIEENTFRPVANSGGRTVGIAVYDSYGANDIYRNSFDKLTSGNVAKGQNTSSLMLNPLMGVLAGLTYTCNENTDNQGDFRVLRKDGAGDIQSVQGSPSMPTGNTFGGSHFHFDNQGTEGVLYYYNDTAAGQTPNASLSYNTSFQGTKSWNPCISHYGNAWVKKSDQEKAALESDYLSSYTAYLGLKQLYESRLDGGNTSAQLSDITNAMPSDLWQLRAQLLGLSPYVSKQVLAAAADRDDIFTDPVLFEILAANPDELRSDSLISYLENKEHPLPGYMVDLLRQIASGTTTRTALVAQMNSSWHGYNLAAGDIVRSNLNDTVGNPTELRNWLGNLGHIAADRMVISSYIQEGDSTNAFTLANMMPELYGLQGEQLEDHAGYMRLIQLYQSLHRSGRTVYELTNAETAVVDSIAENGMGVSRLMAQSLQEQVTGIIHETCLDLDLPELPGGDRGKSVFNEESMNRAMGFTVSVSPNPATTWTVVDYTLPSGMTEATVTLTSTLGINVLSEEINGSQGQKVLDLRGLADGVYAYSVRCGKHTQTGKLIIVK